MAVQGHSRSLILAPIESTLCDLLLVINSNLGRILPCFRDIAGFLQKTASHPYSIQILGCSPLTRLPMLGLRGAKTLSQLFMQFRTNSTYTSMVHQRNRQINGRLTVAIHRAVIISQKVCMSVFKQCIRQDNCLVTAMPRALSLRPKFLSQELET